MPSGEPLEQAAERVPATHGSKLILLVTVFVDLLGFGIVIPFLPMYAQRLRIDAAGVGMILASYSLAQFLCAPILGKVSDRVGRRPVIMLGLFGSAAGYLVYGVANSFGLLLLSRLVHGACAATISTAQAYISDVTEESQRARGMGMIGAAFGLGFVLGPALGGLLGRGSLRIPVFFASALTFLNLLFAAFALPESRRPEAWSELKVVRASASFLGLPSRIARNHLARLFAVAFLLTFVFAALEATFALMVPGVYGYGAFGVGGLLALAGIVQAVAQGYLVGKLSEPLGESRLLRLGIILLAIGFAPLGTLSSRVSLFILLILLSSGYGLASPAVASLISKRAGAAGHGEMLGVGQSALSLARIFGPLAGGFVYQKLGVSAPYVGGALVALVALLITQSRSDASERGQGAKP